MASETGQAQHPHPPARQEASPPSPSSAAHNGGDHGSAAAGLLPVGNGNGTAAKLKDTTEPQQQQPLLPRAPEPEPERAPLFPDDDDDEDADGDGNDSPSVPSEPASEEGRVSSPPYWMHSRPAAQQQQRGVLATTTRHARAASGASSAESVLPPGAITLQDNERDDEGGVSCGDGNGNGNGNGNGWHGYRPWEAGAASAYGRDRNRACWARSVQVTDYVLVNGSATNIGAFVVWIIRVETLNVRLFFLPDTHKHTHHTHTFPPSFQEYRSTARTGG